MLDCVPLPHASTLSRRLASKDSAHGQRERQNAQLLSCVAVIADCMKFAGSLSRLTKPASRLKEMGQ